jgi:Zn-dependent peptidase ImmA (M78 family)
MKGDDTLAADSLLVVHEQAARLLREASAHGRFPTPVEDLIEAAKLTLDRENSLNSGVIARLYRGISDRILRAIDKVLGLLDSRARTIYIDQSVHKSKKPFLLLHETGHGFMPWQRDTYLFMEDGQKNLDPDIREEFEAEANAFASEVLFQGDVFLKHAQDMEFGLKSARELAKKFGSSIYAAVRKYVATCERPCAVLVLEQPVIHPLHGHTYELRRALYSKSFHNQQERIDWPTHLHADSFPPDALPVIFGRTIRVLKPRLVVLSQGDATLRFVAEAFDSSHQVFLLLYPESVLRNRNLLV